MVSISIEQPANQCSQMGVLTAVHRYLYPDAGLSDAYPLCRPRRRRFCSTSIRNSARRGRIVMMMRCWVTISVGSVSRRPVSGFFFLVSLQADRAPVEAAIRQHLQRGLPVAACNYDWQLLIAADDTGFTCTQPWGDLPMTPARLTAGT